MNAQIHYIFFFISNAMQTIIAHNILYLHHINQKGIRNFGLFSTISFKIVSVVIDEHGWAYKNSNYREILIVRCLLSN